MTIQYKNINEFLDAMNLPWLKGSLYGSQELAFLLDLLNKSSGLGHSKACKVLEKFRKYGKKVAKRYLDITFEALVEKERSQRQPNPVVKDSLKTAWAALSRMMESRGPLRLRRCQSCPQYFFDRSRNNRKKQCDHCSSVEKTTSSAQTRKNLDEPSLVREIPDLPNLYRELSVGHFNEKRMRHEGLTNSCGVCRRFPRSLWLAVEWVRSHNPFLQDLWNCLPQTLAEQLEVKQGRCKHSEFLIYLGWCIREADHLKALGSSNLVRGLEELITINSHFTLPTLLDLTWLPPDPALVQKTAQVGFRSSTTREDSRIQFERHGITRPSGALTSQAFWTACGGPLAVCLFPTIQGRKRKHRNQTRNHSEEARPVPEKLWVDILSLWKARYPHMSFPSPQALRRRITPAFFPY